MLLALSGDCAIAGLRATLSPSLPSEPQSVPRRQRGAINQNGLRPEGARQEFVTFQVGEAQTGRRQAAIRMPFGSRIRN